MSASGTGIFGRPDDDVRPDRGVPRPSPWHGQGRVVAAVALGGAAGAAARHAAALLWPTAEGAFPWTTLAVNVTGCAVIGVFMAVLGQATAAHPLLRPFFGTGVLGGFTTFSTYAVDVRSLLDGGGAVAGLGALVLTPVAALAAAWAGAASARRMITSGRRRTAGR
jgi:CrcB protein